MDYADLLCGPIYAAFGTPATLTPSRPEAAGIAVTVIERTATTDASDEFELGTLRPAAFVRRRELADAGIAPAELDCGTLVFDEDDRGQRTAARAGRRGLGRDPDAPRRGRR